MTPRRIADGDQDAAAARDARGLLAARAAAGVRVVDPRHVELYEWVLDAFERYPPDDMCPHIGGGTAPQVVRGSLVHHRRPALWCQPCHDQLERARAALGLGRYRCDRCSHAAGAVRAAVVVGPALVDVALCPGCAGDSGLTPDPDTRPDGGSLSLTDTDWRTQ